MATEQESTRRRGPGRRREASTLRVWVLAFLGVFLLGAGWSLATPYDGQPDELQHVIRAYGVVDGQINAGPANSPVRTAKSLVPEGKACFRWHLDKTGDCQAEPGSVPAEQHIKIHEGSGASGYDPSYYLYVGPVIHLWPNMTGVVLARLLTAAEMSALIASAVAVAWSSRRGRWLLGGIMVGVTPVAASLLGAVNPAGVEIAAALAFWVCVLDLFSPDAPPRKWVAMTAAWSGAVFAVTRGFGFGWMGLAVLVCALTINWAKIKELWASVPVRWAVGIIGAACCLAVAWDMSAGANYPLTANTTSKTSLPQIIIQELWVRIPFYLDGTARQVSYGDIPIPTVVTYVWLAGVGFFIVGGMILGNWRERLQIAAVAVGAIAILAVSDINAVRQGMWFSQGRYALPLLVGAPMLGAAVMGRTGVLTPRVNTQALRCLAVGLLPVHLLVLAVTMVRFERGFPTNGVLAVNPFRGSWTPPAGAELPVILLCLGLLLIGWLMWRGVPEEPQDLSDAPTRRLRTAAV
ncbi:DUF2142 domain-containing protein [Catenulispora yoronensis]